MKVADLNSTQIDHWVAKAEGIEVKYSTARQYWRLVDRLEEIPWSPHNDWAQGGPLIEREKIELSCAGDAQWRATGKKQENASGAPCVHEGRTPLEAAMKCYIAMKFGDEVSDQ